MENVQTPNHQNVSATPKKRSKFKTGVKYFFFAIGGLTIASFAIGIVQGMQGGHIPNCAAPETIATLKQAVSQQIATELNTPPGKGFDFAKSMTVTFIQTKAHDEKLDSYTCEGKLTYTVPADRLAKIVALANDIKKTAAFDPDAAERMVVLEKFGSFQKNVIAFGLTPDVGTKPVEFNVAYEVQKLEGQGEKGKMAVKATGLTSDDALEIGTLEAMAALNYAAPALNPAVVASESKPLEVAKVAIQEPAPVTPPSPAQPVQTAPQPVTQVALATQQQPPQSTKSGVIEASFDCAKASSKIEKLICSTPETANADKRLASAYSAARAKSTNDGQIKADQRDWMKSERNACNDSACLLKVTENRIQQLGTTIH